jgi:high frequency lysogenization protein
MNEGIENRTVALAGLCQSVRLVRQYAWDGRADPTAFACSARSVLMLDSDTYPAVYGGLAGVKTGLEALRAMAGFKDPNAEPRLMEELRYLLALIRLQRQLSHNEKMKEALGRGIAEAKRMDSPQDSIEALAGRLGELYQLSISTLSPRILVHGDQGHLGNTQTAACIRTLLLAGIRAVTLWRQAGGGRLRLLLERRTVLETCTALLARL